MDRAKEVGSVSLRFSLLGAGVFKGDRPLEHVLEIGCRAIIDAQYPGHEEVHLVAYTDDEVVALQSVFASLPPPTKHLPR